MRRHMTEKPYKCPDCSDAFYRKYLLKNHIEQKHSPKKEFCCSNEKVAEFKERNLKFDDNNHLEFSLRRHMPNDDTLTQYLD